MGGGMSASDPLRTFGLSVLKGNYPAQMVIRLNLLNWSHRPEVDCQLQKVIVV
jgi:hypothetical protein